MGTAMTRWIRAATFFAVAMATLLVISQGVSAGETKPYNCWVKSGSGRDAGALYDYYIEFRVPKGSGKLARTRIQALSWNASRCFSLSTVTKVTSNSRYDYFTVIAGFKARFVAGYFAKDAWEFGKDLRCYY